MANKRFEIGLTGGIGSGKSTVAKLLEKHGFYTIDADVLSRQVMEKGGSAYDKVVEAFGNDILFETGEINRKKLGDIVFSDSSKRVLLEQIVHPALWELERRKRGEILGKDSKALIVTHAALLAETGSYKKYMPLIVVYCSEETQLRRVTERDGLSKESALSRIKAQLPMQDKLALAHIIIDNDKDDLSSLEKEVERVAEMIKVMTYAICH